MNNAIDDNCGYFTKDCDSCKYGLTHTFCDDAKCHACPNFAPLGESGCGLCNCFRDADQTLEHCPHWRSQDD